MSLLCVKRSADDHRRNSCHHCVDSVHSLKKQTRSKYTDEARNTYSDGELQSWEVFDPRLETVV